MSTPKQIAASRANGARSKGPVTERGKRNSSRNSTRHGLFAETIVLENEKEEEFIALLDELFNEHQPATPTETIMVEAIAAARWRQDRIWGMQKVAFDHDVAFSPSDSSSPPLRAVLSLQNSAESVRAHELLLRYDIAFDRQISRALLRLQQLQDRRLERTARPVGSNTPGAVHIEVAQHVDEPGPSSPKPVPAPEDHAQRGASGVAPRSVPAKSELQPIRSRKDIPAKRTQQLAGNNHPAMPVGSLPSQHGGKASR